MKPMTIALMYVDYETDHTHVLFARAETHDGKTFRIDREIEETKRPYRAVGIDMLDNPDELVALGGKLLAEAYGPAIADRAVADIVQTRETENEIRDTITSLLDASGFEYAKGELALAPSHRTAADMKVLRDGEPCGHRGCLHHLTHPCEGCGRIGGRLYAGLGRHDDAEELGPAPLDKTKIEWWVDEFCKVTRDHPMVTCTCRTHLGKGKWLEAEVSACAHYHVGDAFRTLLAPMGLAKPTMWHHLECSKIGPATRADAKKYGGGYVIHSVRWLYDTETMKTERNRSLGQ